jgi:hypothetical protein
MAPKGAIFLDTTTLDAGAAFFAAVAIGMRCAARAGVASMRGAARDV